jgi:hypothetical protein
MRDGNDLFDTRHRRKNGDTWPVEVSVSFSNSRRKNKSSRNRGLSGP